MGPKRQVWSSGVLAVVLLATLASCGGSGAGTKAGEAPAAALVLTLANNNDSIPPQLASFAEELERRSTGDIDLNVDNDWRRGEPTQERDTVDDVRKGKVDMAWVGVRALDSAGVTSFRALVAPLLIDSYELQGRVFDSGIPARMLESIDGAGLTGIGVLPGPMRKMMGVSHPFTKPADFRGQVVGTSGGELAERTLQALGATPKLVPAQAALSGLDGLEYQLAAIDGNDYPDSASHVTANVNLWPRPLVIIMNPDRFRALSPARKQRLHAAAEAAVRPALDASRAEDSQSGPQLCRKGITVVEATASDLAATHEVIRPVYADLEQDAATSAFLREIRTLKSETTAGAETFSCRTEDGTSSATGRTPMDGLFEVSFTREEFAAAGADAGELEHSVNWGSFTMRLDSGRFVVTHRATASKTNGRYSVVDNRFTMTYEGKTAGEVFGVLWSMDGESLTLARDGVEWEWTGLVVKPWRRIS